MTVHQAILFRRSISSNCFSNTRNNSLEDRKHNNTPVFKKETPRKRASMVDVSSIPPFCGGNDKEKSGKSSLKPAGSNVTMTFQSPEKNPSNLEIKCSLFVNAENQDLRKNFVQAKKIDIKLPCLDTNHET